MRFYGYDIRINYLPMYLALPIMAGWIYITAYLAKLLLEGTWPAVLFIMGTVMMTVETFDKTRKERTGKILTLRKVDPL